MKYKDRDELVEGLREFADFIEEHGLELPIRKPKVTMSQWLYDSQEYVGSEYVTTMPAKEKARRAALTMGNIKKDWTSYALDLRKDFGPVVLEFSISKENICEKKVVGFKDIPEHVVEAHREELVEWICKDSILAT
jgi:predicted SAM-dependent methyltransferase